MRLVRFPQRLQFGLVQFDFERRNRILQMLHFAGAHDGSGNTGLRQHPGQRHLRIRYAALACDFG